MSRTAREAKEHVGKLVALAKAMLEYGELPEDVVYDILVPIFGGEGALAITAAKMQIENLEAEEETYEREHSTMSTPHKPRWTR